MECGSATRSSDREDVVLLAREHQEAREAFAELVLRLPEPWRSRILKDDREGPSLGHRWPLKRLEAAYELLLDCEKNSRARQIASQITAAKRYKRVIDRAREALLLANVGLAVLVARKVSHRGIPFQDLVQEGNIGLINAVERFDCNRGCKFSTYAVWWIRQSISKAFVEKLRLIRLPGHIEDSIGMVKRATGELAGLLGRKPTKEEIARETGLSEKKVARLIGIARKVSPLESFGSEKREGLLERVADENALGPLDSTLEREMAESVVEELGRLSRKEERILRLRFGIECKRQHTLREIGRMYSVSRERIRQIEARALSKLRKALGAFRCDAPSPAGSDDRGRFRG